MSYPNLFTGSCFAQGFANTKVPTGGDSAALWNRPTPAGIPLPPPEEVLGSYDMTRALQDEWGRARLYRHDVINMPPTLTPACGAPPFVPAPGMKPVDLSKRDFFYPLPAADPVYAKKLFIDQFFQDTPIIGNQQLEGGMCFDSATV